MLPHVPQDLPDPEIEAQTLLRNGVPAHIRCYVPFPSHNRDVVVLTDDILQAEMVAQEAGNDGHAQQEPVPATDKAGPSEPRHVEGPLEEDEPQYVVGPLEEEEDEPQHVVGPLEEEPDQVMLEPLMPFQEVADLLAQEDDELMPLEPPQ